MLLAFLEILIACYKEGARGRKLIVFNLTLGFRYIVYKGVKGSTISSKS